MRALERALRRLLGILDAAATRCYGWRWNPLHQSGTLAVAMLLVLLVTGLYLVFFYRVGAPYASVARLAGDPWLGAWVRLLHRYATDLFVLAALAHALRMFAQRRSWGPRTLAWLSGLFLLGAGLICAWTGYVMVWDRFGERLALEGARLFDALPFFSEPLARMFAGEGPVPSAFFFVNLFVHLALPLAFGAGLWLHVSKLARPALLPPRPILWGSVLALTAIAVLIPVPPGEPADPFRLASSTPSDVLVGGWLLLTERLPAGLAWSAGLGLSLLAMLVPRLARRRREGSWAPSLVDPRLCTGCDQCTQDCPWEAITLVPRDDGRPTLVARVNPERCVSCGICAGSCAPMGVGPPGRTGRDQLAEVRRELLPALAAKDPAPIVALACAEAPASHLAALAARGLHLHLLSCAGNLHSSVIELLIRQGTPGVLVCSCPPRDCVGREGPKWLDQRLYHEREAELQERVDRRRVRVIRIAPGGLAAMLAACDGFASEIAAQGRPEPEPAELETACEPVTREDAS